MAVPRPAPQGTPEALPYPILRRLSRPRYTALRLAAGCSGEAAAARWVRGRMGEGWPLVGVLAHHLGLESVGPALCTAAVVLLALYELLMALPLQRVHLVPCIRR